MPSVEWLPSSGEEQENADGVDELHSLRDKEGRIIDTSDILNMTGVRDLHQMENAREKLQILEKKKPNDHQLVLNR